MIVAAKKIFSAHGKNSSVQMERQLTCTMCTNDNARLSAGMSINLKMVQATSLEPQTNVTQNVLKKHSTMMQKVSST
jgi:hypothetical protein